MMKGKALKTTWLIGLLLLVAVLPAMGQLVGQNPDFDSVAAEEEAYWYSRYNLGHLTMRSGMGETFMPDPAMVEMMIAAVDADPNDGDTAMPPENPALLRTVYAAGDPHWTQPADPMDFATMRWDPRTFDRRVTGAALGWTMVKELEWAKQFHVDDHFGTPSDPFGAQWRFVGMVMVAMAKMQAQSWIGLHEAGTMVMVDQSDPFVMLMAISDLASVLGAQALPHSASNNYRDDEAAVMFRGVANEQFDRVNAMSPRTMSTKELAVAIQGLAWFAAVTDDAARQRQALDQIADLGRQLVLSPKTSVGEKGYALRGLIEAYRLTNCVTCRSAVTGIFDNLAFAYDEQHGVFTGQTTYTIDDVAAIVGGLNAAKLFGEADEARVEEIFTGFFESVVNLSGLQQSVPPKEESKGAFEQDEPDIYYGYPSLPQPTASGEYGIAPVFATSVTFDPTSGTWTGIDTRFDTAGAMHAANEFIWLHFDEVSGFPVVVPIAIAAPEPVKEVKTGANTAIMLLILAGLVAGAIAFLVLRR